MKTVLDYKELTDHVRGTIAVRMLGRRGKKFPEALSDLINDLTQLLNEAEQANNTHEALTIKAKLQIARTLTEDEYRIMDRQFR